MTIVGIGIDAVDIRRFAEAAARRPRLLDRLFTVDERSHAEGRRRPAEHLAARFAAKEAVMKALGHGIGAMGFREIEVVTDRSAPTVAARGAPTLRLHGAAAALAEARHVMHWHVSLTHTETMAMAYVVAEAAGT